MNKHIVCTHRNTFSAYSRYWDTVDLDIEYLADNTNGLLQPTKPSLLYTESDIRKTYGFKEEVSKNHFWNAHGNRNIIWFYAHFRMVYYYSLNPSYDYYWFYDDDVVAKDWDLFHKAFENNDADFLANYVFKEKSVNSQPKVPNVNDEMASGNGWFDRFPGEGDILPQDTTDMFGSFFPVVRLSNRALNKLNNLLLDGVHGYSEGFVPTILNYFGYSLDTIYNNKSQGNNFDDTIVQLVHKNNKTNWSWL